MVNLNLVQEIALNCATCKEAEKMYYELISKGFEKDSAKETIKAVKEAIKAKKAGIKAEKDFVKGWFADFEKVGKSLLIGICKEENISFASIAEQFEKVETFIGEYVKKASCLGQPIRKEKGIWHYREITALNVRGILSDCVRNYISVINGINVDFVRIESSEIIG